MCIKDEYGEIFNIPLIDGIDASVQAQWSRFWWASTLGDKISIISDIDMFPISKPYFIDQIVPYNLDEYIHLNPISETELPACYHIASGDIFKEFLRIDSLWKDSMENLIKYCENKNARCGNSRYWFADEIYTRDMLYNQEVVMLPRDGGHGARRINRTDQYGDIETYIDCHSIRPYSSYKTSIDRMVEQLCLKK
jgi:hypothetical protein